MKLRWREFVKISEYKDDTGWPYYVQWAVWCWRKPVFIGLPLVSMVLPILVFDLLYIFLGGLVTWSQHRWGR